MIMIKKQYDTKKIRALANQYHLKLVLLFGSRTRGQTHKESDFDIAVYPERPLSGEDLIQLNYEFTLLVGNDHVDLVDLRKAPPLLMKMISDEAKVLYQKNSDEFINFYIYALRRYREARPLFELRHQQLKAEFKSGRL